ncbi:MULTISPECIES: IS110 family transposase [Paenibacillus]|uniref:IS110 family transposase n=1 Tax=Paenibacillus tianjinensis TaxID=2810347 RepID=A0ABX7LKH1_9BACL|nr:MULTISPECIES: IS110 family transposase [Paenibacillus]MDF9839624.1 transposase [Paenibacillus sp. PastF-2]MDF9846205.1 transposase [Paenibacillus sp. PastM-2]MDF9852777.1 transposase [Paenibacillus sp. PastF-1]MDH6477493.1 transposase [Paenibacillus sp. PastH-2]QSF44675.1 IS110 family transposase [Paenibacillus tianjinensis]
MKYKQSKKQNQRIIRISENTLVVGADIAKETHVARAIDFRGIELGKDCVFSNTRTGLEQLVQWMKELQREHAKSDVLFGIEPTGHYWFTLAEYLGRQGIPLVIVNPHHVHKSKELEDNSPTKNDYKDAKVIADLVRNGKYSEPKLPTSVYADLRILMNLREKIMVNFGQVQRRVQNWLDRFFPEYTQVFKDWEGKASRITLGEFPTPGEVVEMGTEAIVQRWKKDVKRAVGAKRAQYLMETARSSIGLTEGLPAAKIEIKMLLEQYEMFARQLEEILAEVERLLSQIPGTEEMLTVPGVAVVTLAGFLAEVGDLSGYEHGQQIIRLAGLNLKENSSGKKKGKSSITKRGRARLRALLFRAVMPMVAKNAEFKALHQYFTKRSQNPLKKKQSIVALCGKLIRVLHTLGTKQIPYDANDVLGPVRQAQLQMAA